MAEIAAAAGVGRSTLYRHFPTRGTLNQALEDQADSDQSSPADARLVPGQVVTMPFQSPGQLGRDRPLALEVTRILDEVPPHLVPDQLVAEARRAAGVAVALYVVDIDGSHLLRLAGSQEFPDRIEDAPALGPEIVPEELPEFYARLQQQLPGLRRRAALAARPGPRAAALRRHPHRVAHGHRQTGRRRARARQRLHRLHRGRPPTQTPPPRRGDPAEPLSPHGSPGSPARSSRASCYRPTRSAATGLTSSRTATAPGWQSPTPPARTHRRRSRRRSTRRAPRRPTRRKRARRRATHGRHRAPCSETRRLHVTALIARWHAATATLIWVNCGHPRGLPRRRRRQPERTREPSYPALGTGQQQPTFTPTSVTSILANGSSS